MSWKPVAMLTAGRLVDSMVGLAVAMVETARGSPTGMGARMPAVSMLLRTSHGA